VSDARERELAEKAALAAAATRRAIAKRSEKRPVAEPPKAAEIPKVQEKIEEHRATMGLPPPRRTWTLTYVDPRTGRRKTERFTSAKAMIERRKELGKIFKAPQKPPDITVARAPPPEPPKSRIKQRTQQLKRFLEADIKDPALRSQTLATLASTLSTVEASAQRGEKAAQELAEKYTAKMQQYERLAQYDKPIGLKELRSPQREKYLNMIRARAAHMSMATAKGLVEALPVTALAAAGGPLTMGLVSGLGVASMARRENRRAMARYIEKHPQQFLGELAGSILAGATVDQAAKAFKAYTRNVKLRQRRALEEKWDRMIDDINYLQQQYGAEFPSRLKFEGFEFFYDPKTGRFKPVELWGKAKEPPPGLGKKPPKVETLRLTQVGDDWVLVTESGGTTTVKKLLKGDVKVEQISAPGGWSLQSGATGRQAATGVPVIQSGGRQASILLPPQLVEKYPQLAEPWLHPAFRDPNVLNKADLVARMARNRANWSTLLAAVLARAAAQGYITEAQIKQMIRQNSRVLEKLEQRNIEPPKLKTPQIETAEDVEKLIQPVVESIEPAVDSPKTREKTISRVKNVVPQAPSMAEALLQEAVAEAAGEPAPPMEPGVVVGVEAEKLRRRRPPRRRVEAPAYVVQHGGRKRIIYTRSIVSAVARGAPPGAREVKVWRLKS